MRITVESGFWWSSRDWLDERCRHLTLNPRSEERRLQQRGAAAFDLISARFGGFQA